MTEIITVIPVALALAYLAASLVAGVWLGITAWIRAARFRRSQEIVEEARLEWKRWVPGLSLGILADGDEASVTDTLGRAVQLGIPDLEIIVVVDAQRTALQDHLVRTFDFRRTFRAQRHEIETTTIHAIFASATCPHLLMVLKRDAGSADGLNAAINASSMPLFAFVPPGTRLDAAVVWRMLEEFVLAGESLAAVVAPIRIDDTGVTAMITEAMRIQCSVPMGDDWAALAAASSSAASFVVYRKRPLELAGGFRPDARNPRIDATLRLSRKLLGWRQSASIRYRPDPAAWEEPRGAMPLTWKRLTGLVESLGRYGGPLAFEGNPHQRRAVRHLMFSEVAAPIIELGILAGFVTALALGAVPGPVFAVAMTLLFGRTMMRAALGTLADCTDRARTGAAYASSRFVGALLYPVALYPLALFARVSAILGGVMSIKPPPMSAKQPGSHGFRPGIAAPKPESAIREPKGEAPPALPTLPAPPPVPAQPPPPMATPPPLTWATVNPTRRRRAAPAEAPLPALPAPGRVEEPAPPTLAPVPVPPPTPRVAPPPVPAPVRAEVAHPLPPPKPAEPPPEPPKPVVVPAAPGKPGPITFEVTSTYQIKADAPAGAMPAIQLPSAGGGPIIVTTTSGQIAIPNPPPGQQQPPPPAHPAPDRTSEPGEDTKVRRAPRRAPTGNTRRMRLPGTTDRIPREEIEPPRELPAPRTPIDRTAETARSEREPSESDSDFFLPISDLPELDPSAPIFAPSETSDRLPPVDPKTARPDRTIDPLLNEPKALAPQPPARTPEPPRTEAPRVDTGDTEVREKKHESSARWPVVPENPRLEEPLDLDDLGSRIGGDSEDVELGDTSTMLPAVSNPELSDPLDLGTVDTDDDSSETSAMLPSVQAESEPLDLDLHDLDAIAETIEKVGSSVALEPVEPGDLKRGLEALSQTTLFQGVRAEERNRIMPFLRSAHIKQGREVIREGDPGRGLFIVQTGSFEVVVDEGRRVVATLGPGEAFGEMSLLTGNPASATVRAVEDSRLFAITKEDFPALTAALPWLGVTLARLIAERISRTSLRVVDELKRGLVGRLELIPPASLIQAVNVNNQSGTLAVQSGRMSFTAYFEDGQIYEAATESQKGEAAFYDFLNWTSGSFRFEPIRRFKVARSIHTDTVGLLLEGTRRVDEAKAASGDLPVAPVSPPTQANERPREVLAFDLSSEKTALDALARIPLFSGLRPDQLHQVFESMQERKAVKGDIVVRQGQLGQALYIIGSGVLDVTARDEAGVESSLAMFGPGDCFGEIALITGEPTTATVTVMADGKLLVIPREEFEQLLGRVPAIGASLARILAARLARASRWINEQAKQGIVGRLESMPATELIQALHVNGQSGTLTGQAESKTVEIDFLDGQITNARSGDLQGDEAVFRFLAWTRGGFKFQPGRPGGERGVKSDTIGLLFRGIRRIERSRDSAAAQGRADIETSDLAANRSGILPNVDTGTAREMPPPRRQPVPADPSIDPALQPPPPPAYDFRPLEPSAVEQSLKTIGMSPLFFGAPASDRVKILPYLKSVKAPAGTTLARLGEEGRALFIVVSGNIDEVEVDEAGGERVVESYEHGECFGEMSFLSDEPATTLLRASSDVSLLAVLREDFPKVSADLPWLGGTLARFIAQRLIVATRLKFREPKKGLFGRLELVPPSALLQSIHANHQSGVLTARAADQTFTAIFKDGQILQARTDDREHEDAVYAFLVWSTGTFRFEPGRQEAAERFVKTDTVSLLLEGNRRLDETKKGSSHTGRAKAGEQPGTRRAKTEVPEIPSLSSPQAAAEALGNLAFFRGVRPDQLLLLVTLMKETRTQAKDEIVRQGAASHAFYIIADGRFDVARMDHGEERKLSSLMPGDCFGEEALVTSQPSATTIVSRDKGRLLAIPREVFGSLLGRIPTLGAAIARTLASRLARTSAWMADPNSAGALTGSIESMPPAEIVQSLNVNAQSGTLAVTHEGKTIEVDFLDGQIQDARIDDLHGDQAFFMLLGWAGGDFKFTPGRPQPKKTVTLDTMGLLFRGLRQLERARTKRAAKE